MKKNLSLFLVAGVLVAGVPFAANAEVAVSNASKDVRVEARTEKLTAELKSVKTVYEVNEPIQLSARTNKKAFVYLIAINRDGSGTVIFPNEIDKENSVAANKELLLPSKADFKSADPGTEHLVLVASVTKLKLSNDKLAAGSKYLELGKDQVSGIFKDIRVEKRQPNEEKVIAELDVVIVKDRNAVAAPPAEPVVEPVVLIATNKLSYKNGEIVVVSYASDTDGMVELWTINPKGEVGSLKEVKVEKGKIYTLKAQALPPLGKQFVVVTYKGKGQDKDGTNKSFNPFVKSLGMAPPAAQAKDLRLVEEKPVEPEAFAVYQFEIQ